jgi:hypothetical protein
MQKVPLAQASFLALDQEQTLSKDNEKILLGVLPVVKRGKLTRLYDGDVVTDIREGCLALEV